MKSVSEERLNYYKNVEKIDKFKTLNSERTNSVKRSNDVFSFKDATSVDR
jgi:hypothetical protein